MCLHVGDKIYYKHRGIVNHLQVLGDSKLADGYEYFNGHKIDLEKQQILLQQSKDEEEKYNDDIKDENYYDHIIEEEEELQSDSADADLPLYQES